MITNSNIMAERRETASGKGGLKLALGSLLASVGMSLSGCSESSAKDNVPNADNTPPAKEMLLASADEAKVFASLSADVQGEIGAAFEKCMEEVEVFAKDGSGGNKDVEQILFQDGSDDCDSIRKSDIGIAKTTQSIISGT